jgi:hypothetical protein
MASITVQPADRDSYMHSGNATTNYGSSAILGNYRYSSTHVRIILAFDLSDDLPASVLINSATLSLYYYAIQNNNPSGQTDRFYRVRRSNWGELQVTWQKYSGSYWTSYGCSDTTNDYDATMYADGTFPGAINNWMTWDVKTLVQDAMDHRSGLLNLRDLILASCACGGNFYSSDYVTDLSLRPKLDIDYDLVGGAGTASMGAKMIAGRLI